MLLLKEFSKTLLLSVAVTLLVTGSGLVKAEEYEIGIILIVLGIVLLLIVAYLETLWKKGIEQKILELKK